MRFGRGLRPGYFLPLLLLLISYHGFGQIRYFRKATVSGKPGRVMPFLAADQDSIATDTIFQLLSQEGYPLRYYRKIRTSVCFDNKCRLLKCTLYWNITGRYLGFELPKGEFLSKAKHKPFKKAEYERLDLLLADPLLPLAGLSYSELAPRPKIRDNKDDVDAVSSATAKNVLDYVVPGSAYTTYKMWHVVYGSTQGEIQDLTKKSLSADLILRILESDDPADKIWALNHIRGFVILTPPLREKLIGFIDNSGYNLAERALNALDTKELHSDTLQTALGDKLAQSSYAIKKLIIAKFKDAPQLREQAIVNLAQVLKSANPELISNVLDVFSEHKISDTVTCQKIASLLNDQNNFVARKAYKYLTQAGVTSEVIREQIKVFEMKM